MLEYKGENMRIRTITCGITIESINDKKFQDASIFIRNAQKYYEEQGYEVETIRISTNSFEQYIKSRKFNDILNEFIQLSSMCDELDVEFLSIGEARNPDAINKLADILKLTSVFNSSGVIGDIHSGATSNGASASARTSGNRFRNRSKYGVTVSTCVCCSMISETQIA